MPFTCLTSSRQRRPTSPAADGAVSSWAPWVALAVMAFATALSGADLRADDSLFTADERAYWAFQPVVRPAVPGPSDNHPVDAFVDARLAEAALEPLGPADRRTLLRRATFDLWGLPPTLAEIEAFEQDTSPDAWQKQIDRLLSSPRYGERLGQHWLDLVHYADSDGFKQDASRPNAYRYRDYVIRSFNEDKPYDRFLSEQIAGDELYPNDKDALIATGYLRQWPYEYNQIDVRNQRQNILNDITDTTGQVFLGLSFGCARCHDHKFDPILQRDFYRLQAFFAPLLPRDVALFETPEAQVEARQRRQEWETATADLRRQMEELEQADRVKLMGSKLGRFPAEIKALVRKPRAELTTEEFLLVNMASLQLDIDEKALESKMMGGPHKDRWQELRKQLDQMNDLRPEVRSKAMGVSDVGPEAPPTIIPDYDETVEPGFLSILDPKDAEIQPPTERTTGRRAALARWLTRTDHPLVPRVLVNRLWQYHFGRGLVATPNDFGKQGVSPTHPELLDWLASEFVSRGWKIKEMHRLLMTSAAYQRGVLAPADHPGKLKDPENQLWWRRQARRMESEPLRDAMLFASGELDLKVGGPGVSDNTPRRSIYLGVQRNSRSSFLMAFDAPDTFESCACRNVTTTSPQALLLLNSPWSLSRARQFAARVFKESKERTSEAMIAKAYELALARQPADAERAAAAKFFAEQSKRIAQRIAAGGEVLEPAGSTPGIDTPTAVTLVDLCHILLNSNEFMYVD